MAALDHRNPNLDDFLGLNWTCWVDRANILASDAESDVEDDNKNGRNSSETMTLRKEDMHVYGQYPALDEFYLVVCSHCGQVVKPQAFEKHCERRHGSLTKMCGQPSTLASQQRPRPGRSVSVSSSQERQKDGRCKEASVPTSAQFLVCQQRSTKAPKETVSLPSVGKFPQEKPPLPHHSASSPCPRVPQRHSGPLPTVICSSSSSSASLSDGLSVHKSPAGQLKETSSPLWGTRSYSRIHRSNDKKECDVNKPCSVVDRERKKLCNQQLICNTDAIHLQQGAFGKTKSFEQLATASAGRDVETLPLRSTEKEKHLEALEEKIASRCRKYNFNNNCHVLRSRCLPESFPEEKSATTVKVEVQPPYPFSQKLLSSEESDDEEQADAADLHATPWHPKPLGLCTFGCRTMGCSIFTFDRRLHHLHFALNAMLEQHGNDDAWKKRPHLSSGLRSHYGTPPRVGSPVRTVTRRSRAPGSLSLESSSLRHVDVRGRYRKPQTTTPTAAGLEPERQCIPTRRPSQEVSATTAQKVVKLSHGSKDKLSSFIRDTPLHDKGQSQTPSSHGPRTDGTFLHRKKPCPSLPLERQFSNIEKRSALPSPHHPTPGCKAKPSGMQQKAVDFDQRALGQKCKGSNVSQPLSSSLSRTSKCQRLSSSPCSSLISWKGERFGDVLSWGVEKRSDF